MHKALRLAAAAAVSAMIWAAAPVAAGDRDHRYLDGKPDEIGHHGRGYFDEHGRKQEDLSVQLGPRPFYLVEGMDDGPLKDRLLQCKDGPFYRTNFSIGHRGAALQFPEHTKESYDAGARMGAGIVECDVTFTKDGELVCRHDECDLHTTTNIIDTPLAAKCEVDWIGPDQNPAPRCCTSALTLAEFKSLKGKMDSSNPAATTRQGYLGGTASWRTDLYAGPGTLMTLRESIELNQKNGVKHTPELKFGDRARLDEVFGPDGAKKYAQKLIDELRSGGVQPHDAWIQSFQKEDLIYWIENAPQYGRQAVFLDSVDLSPRNPSEQVPRQTVTQLRELRAKGVRYFAPPMSALLDLAGDQIVPSQYAKDIKAAGFKIIPWTFERTDLRQGSGVPASAPAASFYYWYDPDGKAITKDSDMYKALHVLAKDVGIEGTFSDWPATVTYYANCMGLK